MEHSVENTCYSQIFNKIRVPFPWSANSIHRKFSQFLGHMADMLKEPYGFGQNFFHQSDGFGLSAATNEKNITINFSYLRRNEMSGIVTDCFRSYFNGFLRHGIYPNPLSGYGTRLMAETKERTKKVGLVCLLTRSALGRCS